jgi:hypothetical protein
MQALLLSALLASSAVHVPVRPKQLSLETPALLAALESVSADRISADLHFLASDAMAGRDTPSPQLRIAALFLRSRVARLGFQPGAEDGWLYDYPLYSWRFDTQSSFLRASSAAGEIQLAFGSDYYFMLGSHAREEHSVQGDIICVGAGTEDELAGLDLEGKWALLLDRGHIPKRPAARCLDAGALGVIATPGPRYPESKKSYAGRYQKRADSALESSSPGLRAPAAANSATDRGPLVMLGRPAAERLFALAEHPFEGDHPPLGHVLGLRFEEERHAANDTELVSNVCAFWPGSDPELGKEVMIISAHYDHVGQRRGEIYNGADDNASGTSGLLALADALVAHGPMKRSVLLLWVSGEEKGLWGSKVWTEDPWLPEGCSPVLDINLDMIGRTEPEELYITPSHSHEAYNIVAEVAYELAPLEGFPELDKQDEYWRRSDHMNFNDNLQIPVIFLSSGDHPDYHKPSDTADKIGYAKMRRIVRLVVRVLEQLQDQNLAP